MREGCQILRDLDTRLWSCINSHDNRGVEGCVYEQIPEGDSQMRMKSFRLFSAESPFNPP